MIPGVTAASGITWPHSLSRVANATANSAQLGRFSIGKPTSRANFSASAVLCCRSTCAYTPQSDRGVGMAEPMRDHIQSFTGKKQRRRVQVSQIVQPGVRKRDFRPR